VLDDLVERLPPDTPVDLPGSKDVSLIENFFDLLQCPTRCFREAEEDMNKSGEIKGSKYEVSLPRDSGETRRNSPSQGKIEKPWITTNQTDDLQLQEDIPVGRCSQRYSLASDTHRENLRFMKRQSKGQ
jgi:hypothetical protein